MLNASTLYFFSYTYYLFYMQLSMYKVSRCRLSPHKKSIIDKPFFKHLSLCQRYTINNIHDPNSLAVSRDSLYILPYSHMLCQLFLSAFLNFFSVFYKIMEKPSIRYFKYEKTVKRKPVTVSDLEFFLTKEIAHCFDFKV